MAETFTLRPVDPAADAALLHDWVTRPYAVYWGLQDASVGEVKAAYAEIDASAHHEALLGLHEDRAAFLVERYAPSYSELASAYDVRPGDVGMHFLVGPADGPTVRGWTRAVIAAVLDLCFEATGTTRVVVEPDVRNDKVQALNTAAGFVPDRVVTLSDKRALLSFCTRESWLAHRPTPDDHRSPA